MILTEMQRLIMLDISLADEADVVAGDVIVGVRAIRTTAVKVVSKRAERVKRLIISSKIVQTSFAKLVANEATASTIAVARTTVD